MSDGFSQYLSEYLNKEVLQSLLFFIILVIFFLYSMCWKNHLNFSLSWPIVNHIIYCLSTAHLNASPRRRVQPYNSYQLFVPVDQGMFNNHPLLVPFCQKMFGVKKIVTKKTMQGTKSLSAKIIFILKPALTASQSCKICHFCKVFFT